MTSREFTVTVEDYNKKKKTIIQHKIRTLLKCYTVQEFNLDEETKSFTFKQTFKIRGYQMVSPKVLTGKFQTENLGILEGKDSLKLILSI